MIQKLRNALSPQMRNYILVGGSVYVLEVVSIVLFQQLGASAVVAVGASFWIGLVVSFILQKLITFKDRRTHHKIVVPQFLAVTALVIFNFCFTIGVTKLLSGVVPAVISRTCALGITTLWNFYLYRTRIFHTEESPVY